MFRPAAAPTYVRPERSPKPEKPGRPTAEAVIAVFLKGLDSPRRIVAGIANREGI
jgi:hypothetical protein